VDDGLRIAGTGAGEGYITHEEENFLEVNFFLELEQSLFFTGLFANFFLGSNGKVGISVNFGMG